MKTSIASMQAEIAALLQVRNFSPGNTKAAAILGARIIGCRVGVQCSRCDGSGHHSRCQQYGTICFKCHGRGVMVPVSAAEWLATLDAAKVASADGTVEQYFHVERAARTASRASDRVMAAWTGSGISPVMLAACQIGSTMSADAKATVIALNGAMCAAFDRVCDAADKVRSIPRTATLAEQAFAYAELDAVVAVALSDVASAAERFHAALPLN